MAGEEEGAVAPLAGGWVSGDGLVGMEKRCLDTKLEGKRKVNTRCETSPEVISVQKIYLRCTAGCRRGRCAGDL